MGNHAEVVLPWVARWVPPTRALGLLLHDPNGAPDFPLLERLVREPQRSRFDVAVYVQATSIKRVLNRDARRYNIADWRPLDEALARIKPHWIVREPVGSNQYALCIGSNGELPAWARQHFWPSRSERGRAICGVVDLTGC